MVRLARRELWKSIYNERERKYLIQIAKADAEVHTIPQGSTLQPLRLSLLRE